DLLDQPSYRQNVSDEIAAASAKGGPNEPMSQQTLEEMRILQLCAMETLRLRIKAVNVRKVVERPFEFRQYRIPVGALICNSPTFAQMSEENFARPNDYWPERWIGSDELERSTMTARYMPFGTFAHICPGKRFSHLWLKISVVELLRRFELERIGPTPGVRE